MATCYSCQTELPDEFEIHRTTLCPSCQRELHVCLNCRFYEPGAHWDCRETVQEPVREKDRANFCDYFMVRKTGGVTGAADARADPAPKAKNDFDRLFDG